MRVKLVITYERELSISDVERLEAILRDQDDLIEFLKDKEVEKKIIL